MVKIRQCDLDKCAHDALIAIRPGAEYAEIFDRDSIGFEVERFGQKRISKGGIIGDRALLEGSELFPVSMVLEEKLSYLPAGDWTVVPYVKDLDGQNIGTGYNENSFDVEVV